MRDNDEKVWQFGTDEQISGANSTAKMEPYKTNQKYKRLAGVGGVIWFGIHSIRLGDCNDRSATIDCR